MDIISALKETGKACINGRLAYDDGFGILRWADEDTLVTLKDIMRGDWQPYPDKKEIRAEKAGELWALRGVYHHTIGDSKNGYDVIKMVFKDGSFIAEHGPYHNQNGWKRIHPPVEDESVERIDLSDLDFTHYLPEEYYATVHINGESGLTRSLADILVSKKGGQKMILEIPKDEDNG
jgi:hypothetical protein